MANNMSENDNTDWDSPDWGPFHWESKNWAKDFQPPRHTPPGPSRPTGPAPALPLRLPSLERAPSPGIVGTVSGNQPGFTSFENNPLAMSFGMQQPPLHEQRPRLPASPSMRNQENQSLVGAALGQSSGGRGISSPVLYDLVNQPRLSTPFTPTPLAPYADTKENQPFGETPSGHSAAGGATLLPGPSEFAAHSGFSTAPTANPPTRAPKVGSASGSKKAAASGSKKAGTKSDDEDEVRGLKRVEMLREFGHFWARCQARYLDEAPPHKAELDVKLGALDLETGKPTDGSQQFISPLSPDRFEPMFEEVGTFDDPDLAKDVHIEGYREDHYYEDIFNPDYDPQDEGWRRGGFVESVLVNAKGRGIIPLLSNWRLTM